MVLLHTCPNKLFSDTAFGMLTFGCALKGMDVCVVHKRHHGIYRYNSITLALHRVSGSVEIVKANNLTLSHATFSWPTVFIMYCSIREIT